MYIKDIFAAKKGPGLSFEIFPPKKIVLWKQFTPLLKV